MINFLMIIITSLINDDEMNTHNNIKYNNKMNSRGIGIQGSWGVDLHFLHARADEYSCIEE